MNLVEFIQSLPTVIRIIVILLLAVLSHFAVQGIRRLSQWLLTAKIKTDVSTKEILTRQYPKFATITTILVSAIPFIIYFPGFIEG